MVHTSKSTIAFVVSVLGLTQDVAAQNPITLGHARSAARAVSAELSAAQAALDAARGRERQAGAFLNPVLGYSREQTGRSGIGTSTQDVISLEQPIEAPGIRSSRRDAARHRVEAAESRVRSVEAQLDFDVARAFAQALASDRRATLADQAARAFASAATTSERQLREGDVSGLAARRMRLETARYAALRAEAVLARSTARLSLATLTAWRVDSAIALTEVTVNDAALVSPDSLVVLALRSRPEIAMATRDIDAAGAEARLAARERFPSVTLIAGSKSEETAAGERLSGFVAGFNLPLPLWDRRGGAIETGLAETRRREAELAAARQRVTREVIDAAQALSSVRGQLNGLGPELSADAATALRSAQIAYTEGELTLLEWLDTVRAYYETEAAIASLRAELLIRAAALQRAVGTNVIGELQ